MKFRIGPAFFLLFLGSIVFYLGNSHINDENPSIGFAMSEDTTIFVNGQPKKVPVQVNNSCLDDFLSFVDGYIKADHILLTTNEIDTTGNGISETVQSFVSVTKDEVIIHNTIRDRNSGILLWDDQIEFPREKLVGRELLLENTAADIDLIDLFLAKRYANFIGSFFTEENDEDWNRKMLLRSLAGHQYGELDLSELYNTAIAKSLRKYNGKIIMDLNEGYPLYYYWNSDKKQFVPLLLS